jgi:predicted permease
LRLVRKSPGFSAAAILTVALGIAATTAMFTVVDGVLLQPLPYPHADRLVSLDLTPLAIDPNRRVLSPEAYFVFRDHARSLEAVGIYAEIDTDRDVNVTGLTEAERVRAIHVSDGVFQALGVRPLVGRVFTSSDDVPSAAPTVVLSYGYWQGHFGNRASVIGKSLIVDGIPREIVGVMPREFPFLDVQNLTLILPLQLPRNTTFQGNFNYYGIARLRDAASVKDASADISQMLPIMYREFPVGPGLSANMFERLRLTPSVMPLKQEVVGNVASVLWILMGGVAVVLLIACANVANLLLVRTAGREAELRLRAALGASRQRLAAQLLSESVMLGMFGGICGLGLSWAALRLLIQQAPAGVPRLDNITIDMTALFFTLGITLLTSLFVGLISVFKHTRVTFHMGSAGARSVTVGPERRRVQVLLVTTQVALAFVLLVCSGLLIRTFIALNRVDPGYVPSGVQTFRVSISPADVPDNQSVIHLERQLQEALAVLPGVSSVAFASAVPMDGNRAPQDNVFVADRENEQRPVPPPRRDMFVSPDYVRTLKIPVLAGRDFTWTDTFNNASVALISEAFAREYWQAPAAALGKRIRPAWSPPWREIVGVVGDVRAEAVDKAARSAVYWPMFVETRSAGTRVSRSVTFAVQSPLTGSSEFVTELRRTTSSFDSTLPVASVETLRSLYARSMARTSFSLILLTLAAAMAFLLSTVGLYAVVSYGVSQRTREIGVRIALGGQRRDVMVPILRGAMATITTGLAFGVLTALLLTRLLSSMLFGVRPADPQTYVLAVLLLAVATAVASYLPVRRALGMDPLVALRSE